MKRTGFKRMSFEEAKLKLKKPLQRPKIKHTATKKKKVISVSRLHKLVWEECKRIIRARYNQAESYMTPFWKCYTCGIVMTYKSDVHTAHGKPKAALPLIYKYDLRNLRTCCYNCNINLGGASDIFIAKLEKEPTGLEFLQEACYKDEFNSWRVKKDTQGIQSKFFLPDLLNNLKLLDK